MNRNEYGTASCSIDNIIQVEFYGCVPEEILKKQKDK